MRKKGETNNIELTPIDKFYVVAMIEGTYDRANRLMRYDTPAEWYLGYAPEEQTEWFPQEENAYGFPSHERAIAANQHAINRQSLHFCGVYIKRVRTRTIIEEEVLG